MHEPKILIVDLGSQYTLVIARTLRELGVRSAVLSPQKASIWLKQHRPEAIILSGGHASVTDKGAPTPGKEILQSHIPILGICYGMQWLAYKLGGKITSTRGHKEYGPANIIIENSSDLFKGLRGKKKVWASHGDTVSKLPKGFKTIATSKGIAAMSYPAKKIWGVQFHPEVEHTPCGKEILSNFIFDICKITRDWKPKNIISSIQEQVIETIGDKKVIGGFSGGVDSTTLFAILSPALKKNLLGICIDGGHLREGELKEIKANARAAKVKLVVIDAVSRFESALRGITDAEKKRSAFKKIYKDILETEAKKFKADAIIQGSLATDYIESGATGGMLIKSHHNIGLSFRINYELHPLKDLFKYEVRSLAKAAGLPKTVSGRHPFPGPGLFIRIIGAPVTAERLNILRFADAEVRRILNEEKADKDISQLVVALDCTPTVGVKGDARVYASSVIVRAVETSDFMTATGHQFASEVRRRISDEVTKHPELVRVFYDETNKPPATTELE